MHGSCKANANNATTLKLLIYSMAEPKTKPTTASVTDYLNAIASEQMRSDCFEVMKMMDDASKQPAVMWGNAIVGFGSYTYKYASGVTGDWPLCGFSPRAQALTIYIMTGFEGYDELIARLGKCKTSKACLYIKKLDDVDRKVLKQLIKNSVKNMKAKYK